MSELDWDLLLHGEVFVDQDGKRIEPPLCVDSPRARLEAKRLLRKYGVGSNIDGDVLWVNSLDGQRMRINNGDWLLYANNEFTVKRREQGAA